MCEPDVRPPLAAGVLLDGLDTSQPSSLISSVRHCVGMGSAAGRVERRRYGRERRGNKLEHARKYELIDVARAVPALRSHS